jgi:hypothetical protein
MMKMLGGVLVLRRVAATDVAAGHAQAQMNPRVANFYAFFADVRLRRRNLDLIEMLAAS